MQTEKKFSFKIGADPEFNLVMQNKKVDAHRTIEFSMANKPNLKRTEDNMGFEIKNFGNIGWDGSDTTAEIRPKPANTPQEVINNINQILKETSPYINMFDMSTISELGPIGGHIHFEVPKGENWGNEKRNSIHRKMSSFYFPILLSENKTNLNLRIRQGYGSLKDHRIEKKFNYPDGRDGFTYEFRCPSAEWMTTPKLATATLAYMAVIYHEILHKPRSFSKYSDVIYKSDKQGDALQTLAIMEFNLLTNQITNKIKKYIKNFEMYEHYKDEIDYLFHQKKVIKDKISASYNINIGWNLNKDSLQPTKKEILMSKNKFKKITKSQDLDEIKKVINIYSNNDTNVALFTETLKDRISAFKWKLKNNYFIFGIRKGINEIISKNITGDYLAGKEIIKTTSDKEAIDNLFARMELKFRPERCATRTSNFFIDFKTGKPKNTNSSLILIGLPYEMRIAENIKPFLELIWNIEKDKTVNTKITGKKTELLNDSLCPNTEKGELYKILNKEKAQEEEIIFARENTNHSMAVNEIVNENNNEEFINNEN